MYPVHELVTALATDPRHVWLAIYHRHLTLPKILDWQFPYYALEPQPLSVHAVVGRRNWLEAAWSLASFFTATKRNWLVFLHDDGTLSPDDAADLAALFPNGRHLARAEADGTMAETLATHPLCRAARAADPALLAVLDTRAFAAGRKYLVLTPPTLFFSRPDALLEHADDPADCCWFTRGPEDRRAVAPELIEQTFGCRPWPQVHPAIALLARAAVDPDLCERALALGPIANASPGRLAATLMAIGAARAGAGGLLGPEYEVCRERRSEHGAVCRHYPSDRSHRFLQEGVERLHQKLLQPNG